MFVSKAITSQEMLKEVRDYFDRELKYASKEQERLDRLRGEKKISKARAVQQHIVVGTIRRHKDFFDGLTIMTKENEGA